MTWSRGGERKDKLLKYTMPLNNNLVIKIHFVLEFYHKKRITIGFNLRFNRRFKVTQFLGNILF